MIRSAFATVVALTAGVGCTAITGCQADRGEVARTEAETFLSKGEVVADLWEKKTPPLLAPGAVPGPTAGGNWSERVGGLKGRTVIARREVLDGTPMLDTYVELHNASGLSTAILLRWPSAVFWWEVTDAAGAKAADATSGAGNELTPPDPPYPLVIPAGASIRLCVTSTWSGYRPNKGGHLDVGRCWEFERGDRNRYYLAGTVTIPPGRKGEWAGTLVLPKAEIPLAVAP